jgi:transcriptional regulator with XRE-family HTH domain
MQSVILRTLRAAKNYQQKDMADLLHMSQPNYSDLETGKTKISNEVAHKLGEVLEVNPMVFSSEKPVVFNHNFTNNGNSKGVVNTEHYNDNTDKELFTSLLQKVDSMFIALQQEKEAVAVERKQVLELMGKLVERLGY